VQLRKQLAAWRKTVGAQLPEPNPNFASPAKPSAKSKKSGKK